MKIIISFVVYDENIITFFRPFFFDVKSGRTLVDPVVLYASVIILIIYFILIIVIAVRCCKFCSRREQHRRRK